MKDRNGWKGARYQDKGSSQQASKVFNIKYELDYLNPDYELEILLDNKITEQGLLLCAKLKPKRASLPEFWFRWDEKDDHLNVDMRPDEGFRDNWQNETHGYKGHRPERVSDRHERAFNLLITIPNLKVFNGVISFHLARDVTIYPPTATIEVRAFDPQVSVKTE